MTKCLCCGKAFENRASECCSETCAQCHVNPTMNCPNAQKNKK